MIANPTIRKLNKINHNFYQKVGTQFDQTRQQSWPGWTTLWERHLANSLTKGMVVADIGCGNGRFQEFLHQSGFEGEYIGYDSSTTLVSKANENKYPEIKSQIHELDFIQNSDELFENLSSLNPDLIVLFGVMHHIPGTKFRKDFIKSLTASLNPDGLLCFTTWEFQSDTRYNARSLSSNEIATELEAQFGEEFGELELEEGDFILDWRRGERAFRYCHAYSDREVNEIAKYAGLKIIDTFLADGKNNSLNRYYILSKA